LEANALGSVRFIFLTIIKQVLDLTERYASALSSCIEMAPPINPDLKVFLRHPFGANLLNLDEKIAQPWEGKMPGATDNKEQPVTLGS